MHLKKNVNILFFQHFEILYFSFIHEFVFLFHFPHGILLMHIYFMLESLFDLPTRLISLISLY